MKILIYGLHFKPDLIGIGKYTGEMADWLSQNKHDIRVVTAPHFYPEWKQEKKLWYYKKQNIPFITWRCPIFVPRHPTGFMRILHSVSFAISSIPILFINLFWKPDIVISIEPPFVTTPHTLIYTLLTHSKSILHIQDLEIDAAYSLNFIKKGFTYNLVKRFETFILNQFNTISTISPMMKTQIIEKNIKNDKIYILPNWANVDKINPSINSDYLRKIFSIPTNKKIILYSGNIGKKQKLDGIIRVAKMMETEYTDYLFLIVGNGASKRSLINSVEEYKVTNVLFKPLVKLEDLGALLTMADIHLITQDENITDFVLPSKLTNILSAGGVSIISANPNTQLAQLVNKYNIGYRITPGSDEELCEAIKKLLTNKFICNKIGINARKYAQDFLSKNSILIDFEKRVLLS